MKMQQTWKTSIMVLTQYHVKTSWQNRFLEVLDRYVCSAATKEGNIMAAAYYERGDSCIMWIVERWSSHTFYKQHKKSTDAKAVGALTKRGLSSPPETTFVKELESFSKEVNQDALTIMLFIDVKAGTEKQFISINRNLVPAGYMCDCWSYESDSPRVEGLIFLSEIHTTKPIDSTLQFSLSRANQ